MASYTVHQKISSMHTYQFTRHSNRNTQSIWITFIRYKSRGHRRKSTTTTTPQTSAHLRPWGHQIWWNDKTYARHSRRRKILHKCLANNVIKLNCTTPETYRKLIQYFKVNDIFYRTYQLKEERAYRVVIKYLHHSTVVDEIRQELSDLGHIVRNIVKARHRITKVSLNLFFVDLEPAANNKDIYNITALQNEIIQVEPPRVNKHNILQCMRCQQYGHTKTYCNKPFVCKMWWAT